MKQTAMVEFIQAMNTDTESDTAFPPCCVCGYSMSVLECVFNQGITGDINSASYRQISEVC